MSREPRESYHPVFWWVMGAVPGGVAGVAAGAAFYGWVLEPLFFTDADGLEDLGPMIVAIFTVVIVGAVGGALAGGAALKRWNERRAL